MIKFLADRRGYAMAYHTVVIALVAVPLLTMTTDIVRALYVNVKIQTAVDAACSAAVQAVDVPHFISTGEVVIDSDDAASYAAREFNATVIAANIQRYSPALTSLNIIDNYKVSCSASAAMEWILPGIPALTMNVFTSSEAMARR